MGKEHVWRTRTAEGDRRVVRARYFGKRWTLAARVAGEEGWTELDDPSMDDLVELRRVLFHKYHRHRVPWERVVEIDRMVRARGGEPLDPRGG